MSGASQPAPAATPSRPRPRRALEAVPAFALTDAASGPGALGSGDAVAPAAGLDRQTLVIVGNGMTSWRLCHELVECGAVAELRVVVLGGERHPAYDRVRLTTLLQGASIDDLLLTGPEWYARVGIELHLGDPVTSIDRDECLVRTARGREVFYDRLVLATGSSPFVPPMPGTELPGVFVYRTIEDLLALQRHAAGRRRAVVVGGGLLGLEAARAVLDLGLAVTLVESGPNLLPRQLDAGGGRRLGEAVEALGVRVLCGRRSVGIAEVPGGLSLALTEGEPLETDLVILSAGVRPASGLARDAGLALAEDGGVAVDRTLQSSDDRVFAIGECASPEGKSHGLVAPGYRMVQVVVANLTGGKAAFRPRPTATRLKTLGVPVASVGELGEDAGDVVTAVWEAPGGYRKVLLRRGRLAGALAVGEWPGWGRVAQGVDAGIRVPPWDLRRFRERGELWSDRRATTSVIEWSDDAVVCTCTGVTRGRLAESCAQGACTVDQLGRATSAGTLCGGCRPLLETLCESVPVGCPAAEAAAAPPRAADTRAFLAPKATPARAMLAVVAAYRRDLDLSSGHGHGHGRPPAAPPRRRTLPPFRAVRASGSFSQAAASGARALAVASAAALVVVAALLALPALPPPATALGERALALLDARPFKLATGFAAAGLAAASLLLTARRRLRWFRLGSAGLWRTVHALLGLLAGLATVLHTGGRLGHNLNRALVLAFLAALATGALAGLLGRRGAGRIHVLALAPLPVLVGLHIVAAFYFR